MRRFPPPPGGSAATDSSHTPSARRTTESPMQFEWEQPRNYPSSPFATAAAAPDGEPAKKRTHYEAMDVDTPPRPSFPASAIATSNPFHFAPPSLATEEAMPTRLDFDTSKFDAEDAFGLNEADAEGTTRGDESMRDAEHEDDRGRSSALSIIKGESRRRRGGGGVAPSSGRDRSSDARPGSKGEEREEEDEDEGMMLGGRKMKGSEFSFQVHHHHAGEGALVGAVPERWLNSNTPYILLGYLQFGSLTLLAVLFLFISFLFVYTLYTDIQARLASLTVELRAEILQCAKAYVDNRCEPATRIPAMERKCSGWEECMGREVLIVGKTRVVAETLAEVVNGFVDVISLKTMLFVILTLGLCIYGSSVALSILPSRQAATSFPSPSPSAPPHFQHLGYPPQFGSHGYAGLPSPGYGPSWSSRDQLRQASAESMGLGAPEVEEEGSKRGSGRRE